MHRVGPGAARPLLLVTATPMEAAALLEQLEEAEPLDLGWGGAHRGRCFGHALILAHLGIGKTNAAAGVALALRATGAAAVVGFGIGGAYLGSFLSIGMVMAAAAEVDLDAGLETEEGWQDMRALGFPLVSREQGELFNRFPTDPALTTRLEAIGLPTGVFGTSDTVTGSFEAGAALQQRFDLAIESMEGAAAAQVCAALGVPFAELRGVSNIVGERDKEAWNPPAAIRAVTAALLEALKAAPPGTLTGA